MNNYYFKVLRSGINTTFQDKGRFHMQHFGVTPGGCMDMKSFLIANALVGNSSDEGNIGFNDLSAKWPWPISRLLVKPILPTSPTQYGGKL